MVWRDEEGKHTDWITAEKMRWENLKGALPDDCYTFCSYIIIIFEMVRWTKLWNRWFKPFFPTIIKYFKSNEKKIMCRIDGFEPNAPNANEYKK